MRLNKIYIPIILFTLSGCIAGAQNIKTLEAKAKKGDPSSQMFLGLCYQQGQGTEQNDSLAVYWFEKSANQGLAESQVLLGHCYREGRGVEKDSTTAYQWYSQAAMCGASLALDALGDSYYYGIGVTRDVIRARYYYSKAANRGYKKSKMKYDKIRFAKDEDDLIFF